VISLVCSRWLERRNRDKRAGALTSDVLPRPRALRLILASYAHSLKFVPFRSSLTKGAGISNIDILGFCSEELPPGAGGMARSGSANSPLGLGGLVSYATPGDWPRQGPGGSGPTRTAGASLGLQWQGSGRW
jgi:hypothetical protein